jgi:hypothetical protein
MKTLANDSHSRKFVLLLISTLLSAGCLFTYRLSPFDKNFDVLIRNRCAVGRQCEIAIGDAADFEWDEMYVFRPGLTDGDITNVLPAINGFEGEFNRKIAFLNHGKVVRRDEGAQIIEGENTPDGYIFFKENASWNCLRYTKGSTFRVTPIKLTNGEGYEITCSNCTESPIFQEF